MVTWLNFPILAARTWSAYFAVLSAGAVLLLAAQPARAADPLSGLTEAQAAVLSTYKSPVVLPRRVPEGYRIYSVQADVGGYYVLYSDGAKTLVVQPSSSDELLQQKFFRPTGDALRSPYLGTYRLTEGTTKDFNIGCLSHTPFTSKTVAATRFIACNSLTAAQLTDVINSAQPISSVHASPAARTPDSLLAGLSGAQQKSLQAMQMPVALFSYVPPGYHIVAVDTSNKRGPGGTNYHVTYSDGRGTIKIEGSGGLGDSDVPMQRLSIPVHSALFGDTTLVANKGGDGPDCITHSASWLTIGLQGAGYFVKGCHVRPYELKHVIESARLVQPL